MLNTNNKVTVRIKHSTLKLGSKCHVAFDNSTGDITKVLDYDEHTVDTTLRPTPVEEFPDAKESECVGEAEFGECSRRQRDGDWESEELELWSVLGAQSDEGKEP